KDYTGLGIDLSYLFTTKSLRNAQVFVQEGRFRRKKPFWSPAGAPRDWLPRLRRRRASTLTLWYQIEAYPPPAERRPELDSTSELKCQLHLNFSVRSST